MRDIKFRAWDKKNKLMRRVKIFDLDYMDDSSGEVNIIFENRKGLSQMALMKDVELMQFTGLKDKNGKEIYEGDNVELTLFDANDKDTQYICEVKFEKGMFILCNNNLDDSFLSFAYIEDDQLEIKSNIYGNKELMK